MSEGIRKEVMFSQGRERVWRAVATREGLAEWMFPNDFEPRVGHRFTFRVPGNPAVGFEGLVVECEVLECAPPRVLAFSWTAGDVVVDTRVSFELEEVGAGTRLILTHSGFGVEEVRSRQAFKGAAYGWAKMLGQLSAVVAGGGGGA